MRITNLSDSRVDYDGLYSWGVMATSEGQQIESTEWLGAANTQYFDGTGSDPGADPRSDPSDYAHQGSGGESWTGEQRVEFGRETGPQLRSGPDHSTADVAALVRNYPRLAAGFVPPGGEVLVVGSESVAGAVAGELRAVGFDPVRHPLDVLYQLRSALSPGGEGLRPMETLESILVEGREVNS